MRPMLLLNAHEIMAHFRRRSLSVDADTLARDDVPPQKLQQLRKSWIARGFRDCTMKGKILTDGAFVLA